MKHKWNNVSYPLKSTDALPPERKVVLCWVEGSALPYCGYVRYSGGDRDCPFFVVYHGNPERGAGVIAWCDCLPDEGPKLSDETKTRIYNDHQPNGDGFPARKGTADG